MQIMICHGSLSNQAQVSLGSTGLPMIPGIKQEVDY